MNKIKENLINGVLWSTIGRYSTLLIQLIVTIILARMLSPYEFGIIGLLDVFIAISYILTESGFGTALIQKKKITETEASSIFFVNLFISTTLYLFLYFLSPFISSFYGIDELTNYARILFLVIPINALASIQNVLLQNSMQFKKLSLISFIASLVSAFVGILLAYYNFGVWALVGMTLSVNISKTILLLVINRWIPRLIISFKALKPLFGFGINIMFTSLLICVFNNLYTLIIGKVYNTRDVGFYNQARRFQELSSNTITETILYVSFPVLVNFKDRKDELRENYKKIITITVFFVVGIMAILFLISDHLFPLLLSEKWSNIIPYVKILCIYGVLFPLHQINNNILKVLKKGKALLRLEIIRRIILIVAICVTIRQGIYTLLVGQIVAISLVIIINMGYSGRFIEYSLKNQIRDVYVYYLIALSCAILTYFITSNIQNPYFNILGTILIFLSSYLGCNKLLKQPALIASLIIIKEKLGLDKPKS